MSPSISEDCIVIGAGVAGLAAAAALASAGRRVLLLDKGRRPGGRLASRPFEQAAFDYGAQFFTVRSPAFRQLVETLTAAGIAVPWFEHEGQTRYCLPAGMNALPRRLAENRRIACEVTATALRREQRHWRIETAGGAIYTAAAVVLTPPVPQALALVDDLDIATHQELSAIAYHRCLAILAVVAGDSAIPPPGFLRLAHEPLQTLADNRQKGLGGAATGVTILAAPDFSLAHWETPQEETARLLLAAAAPWLGSPVTHWRYHRWRYSQPVEAFPAPCYGLPGDPPLVLAGDAFGGPRVEGAYLSGLAAANWLLTR
ncbi:MAG: NAD(P)/FAD-dependent oxidoreductase [Acidobacteriota bacterium]|jgi:predicted NAD/FAD-dependent oxidoreductase